MRQVSGHIAVVQEGRFRLALEDGHSMPFTLHHGAAVEPQDLPHLLAGGSRVRVTYRTTPQRNFHIAQDVRAMAGR